MTFRSRVDNSDGFRESTKGKFTRISGNGGDARYIQLLSQAQCASLGEQAPDLYDVRKPPDPGDDCAHLVRSRCTAVARETNRLVVELGPR